MGKRKKKKGFLYHPEAKGILLYSLAILFFISLISLDQNHPQDNYLGIVGYMIAFTLTYLMGITSYLVVAYLLWAGGKYFMKDTKFLLSKTIYFLLLLTSFSILLNILAENYPQKAKIIEERLYSETLVLPYPKTEVVHRYNLGGVPTYYLYKDLPFFNLQKMLSNFGVTLFFSITSLFSFLLLTSIECIPNIKRLLRITKVLLRFSKNCLEQSFKKRPPKPEPAIRVKEKEIESELEMVKINTIKPKKIQEPSLLASLTEAIAKTSSNYQLPSPTLLNPPKQPDHPTLKKDLAKQAKILEETLKSFGIEGKVVEINCGPTITSFEVQPPIGVKVQRIKTLENDIALNMQAKSIRILAPIPGKAVVGVEIPSIHPQEVSFQEMLLYQQKGKKFQIPILLGKTVTGDYVISDLAKMPHCLIAGATGSGKSVCINTIVMSILMNSSPDDIKLLLIDPKKVELTQYTHLPHMISPVISEAHGAYAAMQWLVREMAIRYEILKTLGLRNITSFNSRKITSQEAESSIPIPEKMPLIVAIIDEFADLMMVSSSDLETPIARIAQMARAVGIHLILATQRPSREVITGIIKANFPTRIAFKVSSRINSQIILDEVGAESLLGNGDLLFLPPGSSTIVRAQGAYISDEEISKVVSTISSQLPTNYLISSFDAMKKQGESIEEDSFSSDNLYSEALQIVLASKNASTTYLQRKLKIGYARAASLIDELEKNGVVGPQEASKPRKVLTASFEDRLN